MTATNPTHGTGGVDTREMPDEHTNTHTDRDEQATEPSDPEGGGEYTHEDVPDIIGFGQDSTQMENTIRKGYAAFVRGEKPRKNPYTKKSYENFSGFKKRKKKLWDGGWKLAAVREGDYDSIHAVVDDHHVHSWTPQSPEVALYDIGAGDPTPAGGLTTKYVYSPIQREFYETRHRAVGAAAKNNRKHMGGFGMTMAELLEKTLHRTTDVRVYERVRPPLIPGDGDGA